MSRRKGCFQQVEWVDGLLSFGKGFGALHFIDFDKCRCLEHFPLFWLIMSRRSGLLTGVNAGLDEFSRITDSCCEDKLSPILDTPHVLVPSPSMRKGSSSTRANGSANSTAPAAESTSNSTSSANGRQKSAWSQKRGWVLYLSCYRYGKLFTTAIASTFLLGRLFLLNRQLPPVA